MVNETIDLATQRIILKIVVFLAMGNDLAYWLNSKQIRFLSSSEHLGVKRIFFSNLHSQIRTETEIDNHQPGIEPIKESAFDSHKNIIVPMCLGFKTVRHQSSSCFSAKTRRLNETIYHNIEDFFTIFFCQ